MSCRRRAPLPLDGLRGRFHDCGHENRAAKIRADGGHPAQGLFDRRLSDGRESRRQGIVLGRAARARNLPAPGAYRLAESRQDGAGGSIPGCSRPRVRGGRARLRGAREDLDQRRDRAALWRIARRRPCPFARGLRRRSAGRRPLWREPARGLFRREHVPSRTRRLESRPGPSVRAP